MTLRDIALVEWEEHKARYRKDNGHPCAKFVTAVLARWKPEAFGPRNDYAASMVGRSPTTLLKERAFLRAARMWNLRLLKDVELEEGDILYISKHGQIVDHVGLYLGGGEVAHLDRGERELSIEPAGSRNVIYIVRR